MFKDKALCIILAERCDLKRSPVTLLFAGGSLGFGDIFWPSNEGDCNCFSEGNQYIVQPSSFYEKFNFSIVARKNQIPFNRVNINHNWV